MRLCNPKSFDLSVLEMSIKGVWYKQNSKIQTWTTKNQIFKSCQVQDPATLNYDFFANSTKCTIATIKPIVGCVWWRRPKDVQRTSWTGWSRGSWAGISDGFWWRGQMTPSLWRNKGNGFQPGFDQSLAAVREGFLSAWRRVG